jgi:hypothetical protein
MGSNPGGVPEPEIYDADSEKDVLGRPKEKVSNRNSQEDNFGKDRLGAKGMKDDPHTTKKSPLALENTYFLKHQGMLGSIPTKGKQLVFEQKNDEGSLLDESNIKE